MHECVVGMQMYVERQSASVLPVDFIWTTVFVIKVHTMRAHKTDATLHQHCRGGGFPVSRSSFLFHRSHSWAPSAVLLFFVHSWISQRPLFCVVLLSRGLLQICHLYLYVISTSAQRRCIDFGCWSCLFFEIGAQTLRQKKQTNCLSISRHVSEPKDKRQQLKFLLKEKGKKTGTVSVST